MLTVTRKTDFALLVLAHLAREPETLCSARELSDRYHLPLAMLTNILKSLCNGGLLLSERGSRGGYRLGTLASDISVLRVMETMEGPIRLVQCVSTDSAGHGTTCVAEACCPIRSPLHRVHEAMRRYLDQISIADIVHEPSETSFVQASVVRG